MPPRSVVLLLALLGCSKTVSVEVALVEPCDQTNQALNGISSFAVATAGSNVDGTPTDDIVTFKAEEEAQPLGVGLGDIIIEVKAFAEDITGGGAASAVPQAVGRTMPLPITEASGDRSVVVSVGKLDTFGKTTNGAGECTTMTADAPVQGRHGHTATFVPVLNQVLIYGGAVFGGDGGSDGTETLLSSAELWDPATGEFELLEGTAGARAYHAATALPDGRVFISGGFGVGATGFVTLVSADIFDPVTKEFKTIVLLQPRAHHTSTLMEGAGLIALVGGCFGTGTNDVCTPTQAGTGAHGPSANLLVTVETFDINSGIATSAVPLASGLEVGRAFHQATSLDNGSNTILVVSGGANSDGPVCGIELFRADNGALARVPSPQINVTFPATKCPVRHAAVSVLDPQGQPKAIIVGGQTRAPGGAPAGSGQVDVFEFTTTAGLALLTSLVNARAGHVAARMADNTVIIVGGSTGVGPTAEVLRPAPGTGTLSAQVLQGAPAQGRERGALAVLPTNQVLFTGGHTLVAPITSVATAELFFGP